MKTNRWNHSLSIVNGKLVAAGGDDWSASVSAETLIGIEWIITNILQTSRNGHAAVSVPAGIITC